MSQPLAADPGLCTHALVLKETAVILLLVAGPVAADQKVLQFEEELARLRAAQEVTTPADDRERLQRLLKIDQGALQARHQLELTNLSTGERETIKDAVEARLNAFNEENVAELLTLLPTEGWFSRYKYGEDGATAAFLIIQHAELPIQKRFLPVLERFAASGDIRPAQYGLLFDRVAVREGRPQRYGTQMRCLGGKMEPEPIEDPANLEERRRPMAFGWPTYTDYLKNFSAC